MVRQFYAGLPEPYSEISGLLDDLRNYRNYCDYQNFLENTSQKLDESIKSTTKIFEIIDNNSA